MIANYFGNEEKLIMHFAENDPNDMGILNYIETLNAILKANSRDIRKAEVGALLKKLDILKIKEFCYHSLARRIFRYGEDDGAINAIYKKIMNSCNRKGPPLNTRNGFQQALVRTGGAEIIGTSQLKSVLLGISHSLRDS